MRTLFISALAMISSFSAISQDTLFTRGGQVIPAKVYEITQTEIKYKKPSNPDGPLYTISKEDIAVIEYKNGSKDVFQSQTQLVDNTYSSAAAPQVNNYYTNPVPRPSVNVVLGAPVMGFWGWNRPYYRPFYYGSGYYHGWHHGHGHRRH